jgi:hypothetical protein
MTGLAEEYLTIAEVAAPLKIKPKTVKNRMAAGIFRVLQEIVDNEKDKEKAFISSKDLLAKVEPEVSWIDTKWKLARF